MKELTFFKTESYGGMDGRAVIVEKYESEEIAREIAMNNIWNSSYVLYKVTMVFENGIISEKEDYLGTIPCYNDIKSMEKSKKYIERMTKEIEVQKNNKRIKEATRIKRIQDLEQRIKCEEKGIRSIQKMLNK